MQTNMTKQRQHAEFPRNSLISTIGVSEEHVFSPQIKGLRFQGAAVRRADSFVGSFGIGDLTGLFVSQSEFG